MTVTAEATIRHTVTLHPIRWCEVHHTAYPHSLFPITMPASFPGDVVCYWSIARHYSESLEFYPACTEENPPTHWAETP